MDKKIAHCDFCGASIEAWEFQDRRAVVLLKKTFCSKCIDEWILRQKQNSSSTRIPLADPVGADPPRRKPLVVCVDDDRPVLSSLRRVLRGEPYDLLTTDSTQEALRWIRYREVNLLIADYRMPVISGTSFLHVVRATSPKTNRIMLTAFPDDPGVQAGLDTSLMRICAKPWDDAELRQTIRELIPATP